ncbi:MAG: Ig-like domain-containing protein, partial [Thermoplasmata archaeon]|nr:Ig-like domain-containing protein [Thermoplasmata archaeon]
RDITPPMVPVNLTLEAPPGGGSLIVSWEANSDDTESYTLQRRRGPDGTLAFLINLTRDDTSFTDQGLENNVPYAYRLMAWDKVPLPSVWSEVVTGTPRDLIPPSMVEGLAINAPSEGGVLEISWDEVTDDAAVYLLFRDAGMGFEVLSEFPRGTLMYVDRDVENDKGYFYKVSAKDASGNEGLPSIALLGMPLDVMAPGPPVVEPMPELTNLSEHQVSGTAEPNSTVVAMVNQEEVNQYEVGLDGTFKGKLELDNGINRVSFKCFDLSSNPSVSTEPILVQVDLNPPYVTSSIPAPDQLEVPVTGLVSLTASEGLVDATVIGRLEFADTGIMVPSSISYSTLTKTITVSPSTQLEKGTRYRVVVNGADPAGNHLTGGDLSFTTERDEEPEPAIGSSMLFAIVLLLLVTALVALFLAIRMRRPPSAEGEEGPDWEPGPTDRPEAMPDYDPRTPEERDTYNGPGWEEY